MLPKYKVITSFSCLDIPDLPDAEAERERQKLFDEQNNILGSNEMDYSDKVYRIHFFNSRYTHDFKVNTTISDAVEHLAIKDGVDLVQFDNSNYGYVAYYNGTENGFEILEEAKERDW